MEVLFTSKVSDTSNWLTKGKERDSLVAEAWTELNTLTLGKSFNAFMPSFRLKDGFIASPFQRNHVQDKSTRCKMLQGAVMTRTKRMKSSFKIKPRNCCMSVVF